MAVQKSKKSRSKRGHRRSHNNNINIPLFVFNNRTNKYNLYHHVDENYIINRKNKLLIK